MCEVCIWISGWLPDHLQPLHELWALQAPLELWAWLTCPERHWSLSRVKAWRVGTLTGCSCGSVSPLVGALLTPESKGHALVLLESCLLLAQHPVFVGFLSIGLASNLLFPLPFWLAKSLSPVLDLCLPPSVCLALSSMLTSGLALTTGQDCPPFVKVP